MGQKSQSTLTNTELELGKTRGIVRELANGTFGKQKKKKHSI